MECCDLFNTLDQLNNNNITKTTTCCDLKENFIYENDVLLCKICYNNISNIIDTPDKIYSSDNNSNKPRYGMPVNDLLPKSSVGTTMYSNYSSIAMNRIEKYQKWNSMPYKERSLYLSSQI